MQCSTPPATGARLREVLNGRNIRVPIDHWFNGVDLRVGSCPPLFDTYNLSHADVKESAYDLQAPKEANAYDLGEPTAQNATGTTAPMQMYDTDSETEL